MSIKLRFKLKAKKGMIKAKGLIKHPMMSYNEAEKKGKKANFLTYIKAEHNGEIVYEASTSQFLSKDPVVKFNFTGGAKGEKVTIYVEDLLGNKSSKKFKIK